MSVRRRKWTDPVAGKTVDAWFVDVSSSRRVVDRNGFESSHRCRRSADPSNTSNSSASRCSMGSTAGTKGGDGTTQARGVREEVHRYLRQGQQQAVRGAVEADDPEDAPRAGTGIPQAQRDLPEEDRDLLGAQARERVVTEDGEQPPHGPSPPSLARSRVGTTRSPPAVQVAEGPGAEVRLPRLRGG